MTESEWLASEDPQAMLRWITDTDITSDVRDVRVGRVCPSDRLLRLFACACGERCGKSNISKSANSMEAMPWAMRWANPKAPTWIKGPDRITQKEKANLLRDIVGNPFRPVEPLRQSGGSCGGQGLEDLDWQSPWLTPTVLAIAQAAYTNRPGRKCERCSNGTLMIGALPSHWKKCPDCHSTGRIEDGSLDPVTLSVLADALEDAGCFVARESRSLMVYMSHGGHCFEVVARPSGVGENEVIHTAKSLTAASKWAEANCGAKDWHRLPAPRAYITPNDHTFPALMADGYLPAKAHPILAHLRSPGPHVRGCWALDLILGKE